MFKKVEESFNRGEDQSITSNMIPESRVPGPQYYSLSAPLRSNKATKLHDLYFRTMRYEGQVESMFGDGIKGTPLFKVGLLWNKYIGWFDWITGTPNQDVDGILYVRIGPGHFDNEAEVTMDLEWKNDETRKYLHKLEIQLLGINVELAHSQCRNSHKMTSTYKPCSKNAFSRKDGPLISPVGDKISERFQIPNLQTFDQDKVKLRVSMWRQNVPDYPEGFLLAQPPILVNFPRLKLKNL